MFFDTVPMIIFCYLKHLHLPQYNNVLQSLHHKVNTMPETLFFGEGDIASCISQFFLPKKQSGGVIQTF